MKTILVDDERLARVELRRLLKTHGDVEVLGEAGGADEALRLIAELEPDLLLLDIQMPGKSGLELLAELETVPHVIFTTAHDEYAIRAFELNALDYLLKPVDPERLAESLDRVRDRLTISTSTSTAASRERLRATDRVFVKDGERFWFVLLGDIPLFESEGNYTLVHLEPGTPLIHRSLNQLEERLDPTQFFRANRRQIINLIGVQSVEKGMQGGLRVTLSNGAEVELSRRRAQEFRERLSL